MSQAQKKLCHQQHSPPVQRLSRWPSSCVRGSCSARVPKSSSERVHREFVHHILEDEVDGQKEGECDTREDGEEGEVNGRHTYDFSVI